MCGVNSKDVYRNTPKMFNHEKKQSTKFINWTKNSKGKVSDPKYSWESAVKAMTFIWTGLTHRLIICSKYHCFSKGMHLIPLKLILIGTFEIWAQRWWMWLYIMNSYLHCAKPVLPKGPPISDARAPLEVKVAFWMTWQLSDHRESVRPMCEVKAQKGFASQKSWGSLIMNC